MMHRRAGTDVGVPEKTRQYMLNARIGQVLSRVIVPGWVLTGAAFKFMEASPSNLPAKTILWLAERLHLDFNWTLVVILGLEAMGIAVMLCLARLARPMAIFLLSVFCLVLIGEMVQGNVTSCGCLGSVKMPPWVMLAIDGSLLLGVLFFDPSNLIRVAPPRYPIVIALILTVGGFGASYWKIIYTAQPAPTATGNETVPGGTVPITNMLPAYWFKSDLSEWVGKPWTEVDLLTYMARKPSGLDKGKRYVVFYSRTCDHCEDMFIDDLRSPEMISMVTAVEVPENKTVLTSPNAWWPGPSEAFELLSLPLGCDWIITTPLTLRIVDGVVECATEGDHRECMELD